MICPLTFIDIRSHEEVTVHCLCDCSQWVAGLQSVVAIVDVRRGLEGQAALQIVLVEVHLSSNVVILLNLLVLVEPTQLRMWVTPHGELDAGVMALLGLSQSQDDWRNWEKNEEIKTALHREQSTAFVKHLTSLKREEKTQKLQASCSVDSYFIRICEEI